MKEQLSRHTASADRSTWDAAFRAWEEAVRVYNADYAAWTKLDDAYQAGKPSLDMIDWSEFKFMDRNTVAHVLDLDKYLADRLASEERLWWSRDPEAARARIRASVETVREYRRQVQANDDRHGYSAATDRGEALCEAMCDAERVLLDMPAPDGEALLWKLDRLFGQEARGEDDFAPAWAMHVVAPIIEDVRRLTLNS